MCLIVTAASAINAITMSVTTTQRITFLTVGTGGATTLREYAVFAAGRFCSAERASSSCHFGRRVFFSERGSKTERRGRVEAVEDVFFARGWGTVPNTRGVDPVLDEV